MVIYVLRSKVFLKNCAKVTDIDEEFEDTLFSELF
jgi:hypothetical protein